MIFGPCSTAKLPLQHYLRPATAPRCAHAPLLQLSDFGKRNLRTFLRNSPGRTVPPSEESVPQAIEG